MLGALDLGEFGFLLDVGVVLVAGVVAMMAMTRLKLPAITGLLLAGAVAGPYGLKLATDEALLNTLGQIGVVLLMFTIGLQYPLSSFRRVGIRLLGGGVLQVGFTAAVTGGICYAVGLPFVACVVIGFAVAHTSTPIVLRSLQEKGEVEAPHGRFIVGTSIMQDLSVIPMLLTLPVLAGQGSTAELLLGTAESLGLALIAVLVLYVLAKRVLPRVLLRADATRAREVFLVALIALCIGMAVATQAAGLSMALGAFVAGIVLAESDFATRAMGDMIPLRDLFTSIFFITLGMLFDARVIVDHPLLLALVFLAILLGKWLLASLAASFMRFPARAALIAGLGLAQFGEFGFVVMAGAAANGLIEVQSVEARIVFAAAVLTMFVNPVLMRLSPHMRAGERLFRPLEKLFGVKEEGKSDDPPQLKDHVVLAGYGVAGRSVATALKAVGIPYVVLEMNAETVRNARRNGESAYYADVTSEEALSSVGIAQARAFVLSINDPSALELTLATMRRVAPNVPVIARARFLSERDELVRRGASDVVVSELEVAVEALARVLRLMGVPRNLIDREIALVRERTQSSARELTIPRATLAAFSMLKDLKIETFLVEPQSNAAGKSLRELNLRKITGATVIAASRGSQVMDNPAPTMPLQPGDVVYLLGNLEQVRDAICLLDTGDSPAQVAFATKVLHRHEVAPPVASPDGASD
ncbi:MAG: cation:proton antiporter [Planctomycetes bacterium]|nr:cation:proton antiporter [Planctomycetota bacterium]